MTKRTSFLTRCLSMLLVLALMLSNVNMGFVVRASAAEFAVTTGKLVAENYELADAQEALLNSGYLASDRTIEYDVPKSAELIEVDADSKKITAKAFGNWVAVKAAVVLADDSVFEEVVLTKDENGNFVGTFTYTENTFSVKAFYELTENVDPAGMLNDIASLKSSYDKMLKTYDVSSMNLGTIVLAMDALTALRDGVSQSMGTISFERKLGDAAGAAVTALETEIANYGKLYMEVLNGAFDTDAVLAYLANNAATYAAAAQATYANLKAIKDDPCMNDSLVDAILQSQDTASYTQWMTLKGMIGTLVAGLEGINADALTITDDVKSTADYAALEAMVKAIGDQASASAATLPVANTFVQANMSMFNVTITLQQKVVENVADSANLIDGAKKTEVITVAEGATKADVLAKATIIAAADAEWANYVAEVTTDITGAIAADCDYVVTYNPKTCKVTYEYAAPETPAEVPYGYQLTLPKNADESKAYDYTVGGVAKEQGAVVTITADTTIGRTTGKAYTTYNMFSILADNYANDDADKILLSGALKGNSEIKVRVPAAIDVLELGYGKLSLAAAYASGYKGLSWAPAAIDAVTFVPGTYEYATSATEATVTYRLDLNGDSGIVNTAVGLKAEAAGQKSTLDGFNENYDAMGELDKTKLGAINGAIATSDFTPGDGEEGYDDPSDAKNQELVAYFQSVVGNIISKNLDKNNKLKIYNHMTGYRDNGLAYYYKNSEAMLAEIESLSQYLHEMLADDEKIAALSILLKNAGFPEYIDKIADLEEGVAYVKNNLTAPNAVIDLTSPNLPTLLNLLQDKNLKPEATGSGNPYLAVDLTVVDDSKSVVTVTVTANGVKTISKTYDIGAKPDAAALLTEAEEFAKTQFNVENLNFYEIVVQKDDQGNALPGKAELEATTKLTEKYYEFYIKYEPKTFEVTVPAIGGNEGQQITVSQAAKTITLPAHNKAGFGIRYTVFGKVYEVKETPVDVTLTDDQLLALSATSITAEEWNYAAEEAGKEDAFKTMKPVKNAQGELTGYDAYVAPGQQGIADLGMDLTKLAAYIGLNGEAMSTVDNTGTLSISLQTILNALLDDAEFTSERMISVGNNGGLVFTGKMDLGYSEDDLFLEGLTFKFHLDGTADQLKQGAGYLKEISPYMTFQSHPVAGGESYLDIDVTLPEKAYEVYLTALLAEADESKDTIGDINSEIAAMFMYDYLEIILNSEADTTTFTNTLAKLGMKQDLTGYEEYYQLLKSALKSVKFNTVEDDGIFDAKMVAEGKDSIDKLMDLVKVDSADVGMYLGMLKEYQPGNNLSMRVVANLTNTAPKMEALVLDLEAKADMDKFDYTEDLSERAKSIKGGSIIMLLNDVQGDVVLKNEAIIDLNGHTVNGSIVANGGRVIIVDSMMDSASCGGAKTVTGNATVLAGKYNTLDASVLKDGYVFEGGSVHNKLFRYENNSIVLMIEEQMEGTKDYLSTVPYMAAEIAIDLILNYYPSASLNLGVGSSAVNTGLEAYEVFGLAFDDMVKLFDEGYLNGDVAVVAQDILDCIKMENVASLNKASLINDILDILVDVDSVYKVAKNGGLLGAVKLGVTDWQVAVKHETSGDYITAGLVPNYDTYREESLSLVIDPIENKTVLRALNELADIVVVGKGETDINIGINDVKLVNNTLVAGGGIETYISLNFCGDNDGDADFTDHGDYNRMLAVIVAFANDKLTKDLIKNGEIVDLNTFMAKTTVGDFFDAMADAIESDKPFDYMVDKVGAYLTSQEIAKLSKLYERFQSEAGQILAKVEAKAPVKAQPLSFLVDNNGLLTLGEYSVGPRSEAVYYNGYGVQFDLLQSKFQLKIKFCTEDSGYKLVFQNPYGDDATATVEAGDSFFINDVEHVLTENGIVNFGDSLPAWFDLNKAGGNLAITYTYSNTTMGGQTMLTPEQMFIWVITQDETDSSGKTFKAVRAKELDSILDYVGCSVWLSNSGVNGLQYHYTLSDAGITYLAGLGYDVVAVDNKQVEFDHGTVIDWKYIKETGELNPNKGVIREGDARYDNSEVARVSNMGTYYGQAFPAKDEKLVRDQNIRFYLALEKDGEEFILYSGLLERDIKIVAEMVQANDTEVEPYKTYVNKLVERAAAYAVANPNVK